MLYAVAIGVFDGIHLGHRVILKKLKELSTALGLIPKVFTVLYPMEYYSAKFPGLIITPTERLQILENFCEYVEFLDLLEISHIEPVDFFHTLRLSGVGAIVVGHDFRFGYKASGDVDLLKYLGTRYGVSVRVVEEVKINQKRVSSSLIREAVINGDMEGAMAMLGRPFSISGKVYMDLGLGRKLGFPTANIDRGHERLVVPKHGVYFSRIRIKNRYFFGVTNVGYRPTVSGERVVKYETHILDFDGDLYGRILNVELLEYLREERRFSDLKELKSAISADVKRSKELIGVWQKRLQSFSPIPLS